MKLYLMLFLPVLFLFLGLCGAGFLATAAQYYARKKEVESGNLSEEGKAYIKKHGNWWP